MNFQTVIILAAALFLSLLAVLRTYPQRRWVTAIALLLPVGFFSIRWAGYRDTWVELGLGWGIAFAGVLLWWIIYGRKIPPPRESDIRVWSEDDPF